MFVCFILLFVLIVVAFWVFLAFWRFFGIFLVLGMFLGVLGFRVLGFFFLIFWPFR